MIEHILLHIWLYLGGLLILAALIKYLMFYNQVMREMREADRRMYTAIDEMRKNHNRYLTTQEVQRSFKENDHYAE